MVGERRRPEAASVTAGAVRMQRMALRVLGTGSWNDCLIGPSALRTDGHSGSHHRTALKARGVRAVQPADNDCAARSAAKGSRAVSRRHGGKALLAGLLKEKLQVRVTCCQRTGQSVAEAEFAAGHWCVACRAVHRDVH